MLSAHSVGFLQDLALVMLAAGLAAVIFRRFKQPIILGYLLAGVLIGPHLLPTPLIKDEPTIRTLAELGVTLLMFSIGLDFNLHKLRRVGPTAAWAATLGILSCGWLGYELGRLFGWGVMDSVFLGALLSISSTTIVSKAVLELGIAGEHASEIMIGVLIIEDVLAIVIITLLSGFSLSGALDVGGALLTTGNIVIFLAVILVLGLLTVPRLLSYVARYRSCEITLISVLAVCFGVALFSVKLGFSVVLGAFVIGVVMGETREIDRIKVLTEPVRDMFNAVFFVSIGMLINPKIMVEYAVPILIITAAVVVVKVLSRQFGTFVAGHDMRTSLKVGMGLSQIGEFSFIIASLGVTLKATSDFLYPIAVGVSAITAFLTPYLMRGSDRVADGMSRVMPRPVKALIEVYYRWVERFPNRRGEEAEFVRQIVYRSIFLIGLNLALIAGIFIAAAFAYPYVPRWIPGLPESAGGVRTLVWLAAVLVSMPVYITTVRKISVLGMVFGEAALGRMTPGKNVAVIRNMIGGVIMLGGVVGLGLFTLVLSTAILPPRNALFVLFAIACVVAFVFERFLAGVYTKARLALQETIARSPSARREITKSVAAPPPRLESLQTATVEVGEDSFAAGRRIHEHSRLLASGVTIVAIERGAARVYQPGEDEILGSGDRLLLLGRRKQLREARGLLR